MTHTDKGNYTGKHRTATNINASVIHAIKNAAKNGALSCAAAHKIAQDCSVNPAEAGRAMDIEEVQITNCQLGIFKHSTDKPATPTDLKLTADLEKALTAGLIKNRLSCEAAWSIATRFNLTKRQIGAACNQLGIKINTCQLGTFG